MSCFSVLKAETLNKIKKVKLEKGQVAPFKGFLLSNNALSKLISTYDHKINLLKLNHKRDSKEYKIELTRSRKSCEARVLSLEKRVKLIKEGNKKVLGLYDKMCNKPKAWHTTPQLHFILGAGVGVLACYGVSQIK